MAEITKPIITDETGRALVEALENTHIVQERVAEINAQAEVIAQQVIDSIPQDYTTLATTVGYLDDSYVTPEMFGGYGDGVHDDTAAFLQACGSGKPVVVNNSRIGSAEISGVKIICNNMILTGQIQFTDTDISGNIVVDGGSFVLERDENIGTRDNSVMHDIVFDIQNCETLLTIAGTTYNFKAYNWTVFGKVRDNVIRIETSTWITYTSFSNMFLGSCDRPIIIDDKSQTKRRIEDIYFKNVYAQKYNEAASCRFITTNSKGFLCVESSFMYDLGSTDTQIYLDRTNETAREVFKILYTGRNIPLSDIVKDSEGNSGRELIEDISDRTYDVNNYSLFPLKIRKDQAFYEFASYGNGNALDVMYSSEDIIGRMFKAGKERKTTSDEYVIGCNLSTGRLSKAMRNSESDTFSVQTYTAREENAYATTKAQIDAYGNGHPIFYEPLRKIIVRYGTTYYDAVGNVVELS